jgi:hypothetical protein
MTVEKSEVPIKRIREIASQDTFSITELPFASVSNVRS